MHQTIILGGKPYNIAFTLGALARFERKSGKSAFSFLASVSSGDYSVTDFLTLIVSGMEAGSALAGTPQTFEVETIADAIQLPDIAEITRILTASVPSEPVNAGEGNGPGATTPQ